MNKHSHAISTLLLLAALLAPWGHSSGEEPPPVAVVAIDAAGRDDAAHLQEQGFIVGGVSMEGIRVYVPAHRLPELRRWAPGARIIEWQPRPRKHSGKANELGKFHDYAALTETLEQYAADFPDICRLESIGDSVQGRALWVLHISDHPDLEEDEPEFKYVGAMHGDEVLGMELCLHAIDRLLNDYEDDARRRALVDETAISFLPLMNPDGLALGTRFNAHGLDLNRSFPEFPDDFAAGTYYDGAPLNTAGREPEVSAVMRWTADNSFVLSANFHTGALVVNYPYDDDSLGSTDSPSPDDALMQYLSRRYSLAHPEMRDNPGFPPDGITNGAAWYSITGGMQDWNYRYAGCVEVTVELADTPPQPPESEIPSHWANNEEAMFRYMEAVHIGIRGRVTDADTGDPLWARVRIEDNTQPAFTDPDVGDYHRLLLPGDYNLVFGAKGYRSHHETGVRVGEANATQLDVVLEPKPAGEGEEGEARPEEGDAPPACGEPPVVVEGEASADEGEPTPTEGENLPGCLRKEGKRRGAQGDALIALLALVTLLAAQGQSTRA